MVCVMIYRDKRERGLDKRREDDDLGSCEVSMRNDIAKVAYEGRIRVSGGDEDIKATFGIGKRVGVAVMAG